WCWGGSWSSMPPLDDDASVGCTLDLQGPTCPRAVPECAPMSGNPSTTLTTTERALVEVNGIEVIDEAERTAKPSDLFWPWFAANVSVFGMSYAAFVYGFGISFVQAVVV